MSVFPRNYFRHKSIRDPLYGFVDLSEIETNLLDTPVFRRLHFIKQLSHAYVVYPSAIHTRFEHSLGCVYIANKMCTELNFDDDRREIVRISALLHDIGHGPFSHLFEQIIKKINPKLSEPHEVISRIIINEDHDIDAILKEKKQRVIELLEKKRTADWESSGKSLSSDIVSSGLDADKLDYLRRDSHHIGVAYGQFDLDRILHTIRSTPPKHTRICIDIKGKDALENYRLGRYLMHAQVYEHHARLVADQMFLQALNLAIYDEKIINEDILKIDPNSSNPKFLEFYKSLDDNSIYDLILKNDKSKVSKEILFNIKNRKLLKRACEFTPKGLEKHADVNSDLMKMKTDDLNGIAKEISDSLKIPSHKIIFHKSKIDIKLYKEGEILFLHKNNVLDLTGSSPFMAKDSVIKYYVFGPEETEIRKKIACKIADRLGVPVDVISDLK
ncbi:MAG: HD domain-containing protein [Thaumarchaeota archaeon]|nr:HD domain-containing protein [Nitrososphaerota archaeon]